MCILRANWTWRLFASWFVECLPNRDLICSCSGSIGCEQFCNGNYIDLTPLQCSIPEFLVVRERDHLNPNNREEKLWGGSVENHLKLHCNSTVTVTRYMLSYGAWRKRWEEDILEQWVECHGTYTQSHRTCENESNGLHCINQSIIFLIWHVIVYVQNWCSALQTETNLTN